MIGRVQKMVIPVDDEDGAKDLRTTAVVFCVPVVSGCDDSRQTYRALIEGSVKFPAPPAQTPVGWRAMF